MVIIMLLKTLRKKIMIFISLKYFRIERKNNGLKIQRVESGYVTNSSK